LERSFSVSDYELCFHFVPAPEMARVNENFLDHSGPTDVITFDHNEAGPDTADWQSAMQSR
jgi:ssRNA-specific RNase YbeY (16S rRNA maturation enzyme)